MITPSSFFRHCFSNCPLLERLVLLTYCMRIYALSIKGGRSFCPHLRMHILNPIFKVVCAKLPASGTAVNKIQDLVGLRREGGGEETSSLRWKYKLFKRRGWKGKQDQVPGLWCSSLLRDSESVLRPSGRSVNWVLIREVTQLHLRFRKITVQWEGWLRKVAETGGLGTS